MWLLLAFLSAVLLGFYDVFKKESLRDNAVLPVLFLNTVFSSLVFVPFILLAFWAPDVLRGTPFSMPVAGWEAHKYILLKSFIVLSSWVFGYFGMKHLPLTIVGPINATRPVMVLLGALLFFGERLNLHQWIGVLLAMLSFFMLSRSGKKEGIDFKHNKWIFFIVMAAVTGAISGLYDKYLMTFLNPMPCWCSRGTTSIKSSSCAPSCCSYGTRGARRAHLSAGSGPLSVSRCSFQRPTSPTSTP